MTNLAELKKLLSTPSDIVITTHRNPDGDAIGSSLALQYFLEIKNHKVTTIAPSDFPVAFSFLDKSDNIIIYDTDEEKGLEKLNTAKIIFALDYNDLDRVDKMGEAIGAANAKKVMIDHHLNPSSFAQFMFSDSTASSTCEMIYRFIELMGDINLLDSKIGTAIYTGILTDTGSFKYSTSTRLFNICGKLLDLGVDDVNIQDVVFNAQPEKNLRILGHCLANRMEVWPEVNTGLIWLSREDYDHFNINRGDTEGIVNYILKIKGIKIAAFIHEQPKITKISLRSKKDISVEKIATKHFRGGGHKNAAGGASFIGLKPTIKKFKKIVYQLYNLEVPQNQSNTL